MTDSKITFGVVKGGVAWAQFSGSANGSNLSGTYIFSPFNDTGSWSGTLTELPAADTATSSGSARP